MLTAFADSEYGCLKEVLVCPPASNDFAEENVRNVAWKNHRLAIEQHKALVNLLRSEGVDCHEIAPTIGMPYQCFMRDSSVVTPWGLLIPQMGFDLRKNEPAIIEKYASTIGAGIWKRVSSGTLEGGDVQLLRPGVAVIGCNGERTTISAATEVSQLFQDEGWECRTIKLHPRFMHLDVIMGILDPENIFCCSGSIQHEDRSWLEMQGFKLHDVREEDTI